MAPVSDIKLIEQILHFDLSQKAEKRCRTWKSRVTQGIQNNIRFCNILLLSLSRASGCFLPTPRLGFVATSFMLIFYRSIDSQPCYHNLPSCVGFQSWWFGGGETLHHASAVSITQDYWRATTEGVDQQHCGWWFFDQYPYSTAHIDHFLIPYPCCAKNTFSLVETMITKVFWVQDSTPYYILRCVGILKLSTHTA